MKSAVDDHGRSVLLNTCFLEEGEIDQIEKIHPRTIKSIIYKKWFESMKTINDEFIEYVYKKSPEVFYGSYTSINVLPPTVRLIAHKSFNTKNLPSIFQERYEAHF